MKHNYFFYLISCFCALIQITHAQVTTQIIPSDNLEKYVKFHSKTPPPVVEMPSVDVVKFRMEDAQSKGKELPFRYGVPIEVSLGLENGTWEVSPSAGGMIWKLAIKLSGIGRALRLQICNSGNEFSGIFGVLNAPEWRHFLLFDREPGCDV